MEKYKYQVSYTLKNPGTPGYFRERFKTKKEANSWISKNRKTLYWHQIAEISPKSKFPKPIVGFDPQGKFQKKIGILQTHFETGMECLGLVFIEDGIHGPPNPNFNELKPEDRSNFRNFASYDALTFVGHGQILEFSDGVRIGMVKDADLAKRDGYRFSFYPRGFSVQELTELFHPENVKVTLWIPIKEDEDLKQFLRGPF